MAAVHQESHHSSTEEFLRVSNENLCGHSFLGGARGISGWRTLRWQFKKSEGRKVIERTEWTEGSEKFKTSYKKRENIRNRWNQRRNKK